MDPTRVHLTLEPRSSCPSSTLAPGRGTDLFSSLRLSNGEEGSSSFFQNNFHIHTTLALAVQHVLRTRARHVYSWCLVQHVLNYGSAGRRPTMRRTTHSHSCHLHHQLSDNILPPLSKLGSSAWAHELFEAPLSTQFSTACSSAVGTADPNGSAVVMK